jgi:uncharacterized membrane protein YcaP (DUF421 family)
MKFFNNWWGINENISPLELSARAAVMFLICLLLIRASGMRPFSRHNTMDTIITFLIGGIVSRGIVGATPFFSCVAGAVVIILLNKAVAKFALLGPATEKTMKGEYMLLYNGGKFYKENMRKAELTESDIYEELRLQCQLGSLEKINTVYLEKTGKVSFVKTDEG